MDRLARAVLLSMFAFPVAAFASAGSLQIHFMNVGQGDGAILISPGGETVLFDNGVERQCDKPLNYLKTLGITKIDYHVASHYHADHIGCTGEILARYPLQKAAFDRGGSYTTAVYTAYVKAIGNLRKTPAAGSRITLDKGTANPVDVEFVAMNGAGVQTTNENDLSLVAVVRYGQLDVEIGGDLSGYKTSNYADIETPVAPDVGKVEVYKVHHHGSKHSSNPFWLQSIRPKISIVSSGKGNSYGHPTQECLDRLHQVQSKTYWTEAGAGATPVQGLDNVSNGPVVLKAEPGGRNFTVTYSGTKTDRYTSW